MKVIYSDQTEMLIIEPESYFEKSFLEKMGQKKPNIQWAAANKLVIDFVKPEATDETN